MTNRAWRIVGRTRSGLVSITIEAEDHGAAVEAAEARGIEVLSCVLIEYTLMGVRQ